MAQKNQASSNPSEEQKIDIKKVIEGEDVILAKRRARIYGEADAQKLDSTRFGISLSGGGIRSAVINLGFLKTLNGFGLVKRADYISTVSGGGYTGSYIQGTLRNYQSYKTHPNFSKFQAFQDYKDFKSYQFNDDFKERSDYQEFKAFNVEEEGLPRYLDYVDYARYNKYSKYKRYLEYQMGINQSLPRKIRKWRTINTREQEDFKTYKEFQCYLSLKSDPDFEKDEAYKRSQSVSDLSTDPSFSEVQSILDADAYLSFQDNRNFKDYPAYLNFIQFRSSNEYLKFKAQVEKWNHYRSFQEIEDFTAYKKGKDSQDFSEYKYYQEYYTYQDSRDIEYSTIKGHIAYNELFTDEHADYMRSRGEYLFPGTGWLKVWNQAVLVVSYTVSLLMSWVAPAIMITLGAWVIAFVRQLVIYDQPEVDGIFQWFIDNKNYFLLGIASFLGIHYLFNILASYSLSISGKFSRAETVISLTAVAAYLVIYLFGIDGFKIPDDIEQIFGYIMIGILLVIVGFIANPNATSLHRFYREQLAKAFLNFTGSHRNVLLKDMYKVESKNDAEFIAPYPLINTCLNLQSEDDAAFNGTKTSDYFLLSPLYSGAKLTGYLHTDDNNGYNAMTLPAAVTISAAAVNPGMGSYSNKILSILTTILNFRLGYWTWNPLKIKKSFAPVWWPFYFLYELFSRIGTDKKMLNISDGGHIENLGVYELLRRKCRLIFAIDGGADPNFTFMDLENLTVRARNEMGIDIRFRPDEIPEEVLKPRPSNGYSKKRFAIADLYQIWDKVIDENGNEKVVHYDNKKTGTLVYIKSTVTAPMGRPDIPKDDKLRYGTYKYKIYHPQFPHESTADQFFDPIQWEAYYQLGQHIAADVLKLDNWEHYAGQAQVLPLDLIFEDFNVEFDGMEASTTSTPVADEEFEVVDRSIPDAAESEAAIEAEEKIIEKEVFYKM